MLHPNLRHHVPSAASTSRSLTTSAASLVRRLPRGYDYAPATSISLAIKERSNDLLRMPVPGPSTDGVSLLSGFKATAPSSNAARLKRRRRRAGIAAEEDLANSVERLTIEAPKDRPGRRQSAIGLGTPKKAGRRKSLAFAVVNGSEGTASPPEMSREELESEVSDILQDQANLEVRKVRARALIWSVRLV